MQRPTISPVAEKSPIDYVCDDLSVALNHTETLISKLIDKLQPVLSIDLPEQVNEDECFKAACPLHETLIRRLSHIERINNSLGALRGRVQL